MHGPRTHPLPFICFYIHPLMHALTPFHLCPCTRMPCMHHAVFCLQFLECLREGMICSWVWHKAECEQRTLLFEHGLMGDACMHAGCQTGRGTRSGWTGSCRPPPLRRELSPTAQPAATTECLHLERQRCCEVAEHQVALQLKAPKWCKRDHCVN